MPSPLKPVMTTTSFAVEISVDDYLAIEQENKKQLRRQKTLFDILTRLSGVSDVEYNGHFGPYVFYTLDAEHVSETGHAPILAAISNYLVTARRNYQSRAEPTMA